MQVGDKSWSYVTQNKKRGKCPEKKGGDKGTQSQTGTDLREKSSACWGFVRSFVGFKSSFL